MSKKNRYGDGTFIKTYMFLSPAFLSLGKRGTAPTVSNCSAQMLILLLGKRTFTRIKRSGKLTYTRTDDNKFDLTYAELAAKGISQQRVTRGIDELLAKGFISIANPGGLFEKDKALYSLVDDYRNWRPEQPPIRKRQRDMKRGYQGKGDGAVQVSPKTKIAHVNGGHQHTCQRGTPYENTHASTWDTL